MAKYTFMRQEIKYIVSPTQYNALMSVVDKYLSLDQYGESNIQSLYFDTDNYRLIRASIEKPNFKEKIRLRKYGGLSKSSDCFLEIKRKACGVVYKRRVSLKEQSAYDFFSDKQPLVDTQIGKELTYFKNFYGRLKPSFLLIYERSAYFHSGSDLRITIDRNIRYRTEQLNLRSHLEGKNLLAEGYRLMEIKTTGAIPLWLTEVLSKEKIFKTSFSKCGKAYIDFIITKQCARSNVNAG